MESWKSKLGGMKRAFSSIQSDQRRMTDEINQVLEASFSEINSEIENGNETSQQNTDNEMPFTALDDDLKPEIDVEVEPDTPQNEKSGRKLNWAGEPTRLLLDLLKEAQPKLGKHGTLRNKTKMFNYLSNEMKKQGLQFSAVQVENKFRAFERQYKKDQHRGKTSLYQRDLDKIFQPLVMYKHEDSGSDFNSDMEETKEDNIVDPRTARVQREVQRELQKTLVKIATERQQYHNKVLYYLKKKEEREQRREERAQKKLKLIEAFIKQI